MYPQCEEFLKYTTISFPDYFHNKRVLDVGILFNNIESYFIDCEYYITDITLDDNDKERNLLAVKYLNFSNNFFDVILCIESLEYDYMWEDSIININRLLKPYGLFIMIMTNLLNDELDNRSNLDIYKLNNVLDFNTLFKYWDCYLDKNTNTVFFIGIKNDEQNNQDNEQNNQDNVKNNQDDVKNNQDNEPEFKFLFKNTIIESENNLITIDNDIIDEKILLLTKYDNNISLINNSNIEIITKYITN